MPLWRPNLFSKFKCQNFLKKPHLPILKSYTGIDANLSFHTSVLNELRPYYKKHSSSSETAQDTKKKELKNDEKSDENPSKTKKSESETEPFVFKISFGEKDAKSSGKEPNDNNPSLRNLIIVALFVAPLLYNLYEGAKDWIAMPNKTTFQEFLNSVAFREGRVERLIVSPDKTMVFVFLKPDLGSSSSMDYDEAQPEESTSSSMSVRRSNIRMAASYVFTIGSLDVFESTLKEAQDRLHGVSGDSATYGKHTWSYIPVIYEPPTGPSPLWGLLEATATLLPIVFIGFLLRNAYMMSKGLGSGSGGGGGPFGGLFGNMTKSKAKLYNAETSVKTSFKDVAGMDEAKEEVHEFVLFLKEPGRYEKLGAKIPKGAILSGPPGTGKTLLAKAIAGEAGVPFLSVSGSEFVEMFVGLGSSRVRDLFEEAKKLSPCIVFIDEIDAIGKARGRGGPGGNDERENTLNQLLVEMDGFTTDSHVVVLAGTNRPDILDPALTRPGRFDRHIRLECPDVNGRRDIYKVHLSKLKLDTAGPSLDQLADRLAYSTPGFAGADIANVCNEGALIAARHEAQTVSFNHLDAAIERVMAGFEKKNRVLLPQERDLVAHHEAGHAVAGWFLEFADPIMKVTIIPRSSGALGFARTLVSDSVLMSRAQILDQLCVTLGGRVAEELFYPPDRTSTGASNDLQKVTQLAYAYVSQYGLDPEIGPITYSNPQESSIFPEKKSHSEATSQLIDTQVRKFINMAHARTQALLKEHQDKLKALATALLERESLGHDELVGILGPRPPFERTHAFYKNIIERKDTVIPKST